MGYRLYSLQVVHMSKDLVVKEISASIQILLKAGVLGRLFRALAIGHQTQFSHVHIRFEVAVRAMMIILIVSILIVL